MVYSCISSKFGFIIPDAMNNRLALFSFFLIFLIFSVDVFSKKEADRVETYSRYEVSFENDTWSGNPFDLEFNVELVSPSGRVINQFGFYAGDNVWKLFFMPDETGRWRYKTLSADSDLSGKEGKFICIKSGIGAPLATSGKQWVFKHGKGCFPLIWAPIVPDGAHWGFRGRPYTDEAVQDALLFSGEVAKATLLGIGELVVAPVGWAKEWPQSALPYIAGKEGDEFFLPFWDELNKKLDAAATMNMGAYIMIFGDDEMNPNRYGITPYSDKEKRLLRYVVARLACYPHILWDTGIDIGEYRDDKWISYFAEWFLQNDLWQHPVSSRSGGGSGGIMPEKGTYFSTGGADLPSRKQLLKQFKDTKTPIAQTDHWRPFISRGTWTTDKIRIAMWRCALSGSQALYVDYNQGKVIQDEVVKGGELVGYAMQFFKQMLHVDITELQPNDDLIKGDGDVILSCKAGYEYVAYDEDGTPFSMFLPGIKTNYFVNWYNPRSGEVIQKEMVQGEKDNLFIPPLEGKDWVLHLYRE